MRSPVVRLPSPACPPNMISISLTITRAPIHGRNCRFRCSIRAATCPRRAAAHLQKELAHHRDVELERMLGQRRFELVAGGLEERGAQRPRAAPRGSAYDNCSSWPAPRPAPRAAGRRRAGAKRARPRATRGAPATRRCAGPRAPTTSPSAVAASSWLLLVPDHAKAPQLGERVALVLAPEGARPVGLDDLDLNGLIHARRRRSRSWRRATSRRGRRTRARRVRLRVRALARPDRARASAFRSAS